MYHSILLLFCFVCYLIVLSFVYCSHRMFVNEFMLSAWFGRIDMNNVVIVFGCDCFYPKKKKNEKREYICFDSVQQRWLTTFFLYWPLAERNWNDRIDGSGSGFIIYYCFSWRFFYRIRFWWARLSFVIVVSHLLNQFLQQKSPRMPFRVQKNIFF